MKKCFECETTEDLHEHHVVPRSRGGTKTVTLCHQCHMKAHGRDGKGLNHSRLTKEGLKRAKERGVKLGSHAQTAGGRETVREANLKRGKQTFDRLYPEVTTAQKELEVQGIKPSSRAVANLLNKKRITTPSGKGSWQSGQVIRILKRASKEKK